MAESDLTVPAPGVTNGKLDLNKITTQFAQFMDVDTAKEVNFAFKQHKQLPEIIF